MKKRNWITIGATLFLALFLVNVNAHALSPEAAGGIAEDLTISGLIEAEASFGEDFAGNNASDVVLATVELGVDAKINDWVDGHIQFLFEEDDTPFDIDEGTITMRNPEVCPGYVTAGKMYVPFGSFETHMVSDPLTLELGETNESAVLVGLEATGFYASVYAFNGQVEDDQNDEADCFGASAGYAYEDNGMSMDLGIDYISSIGDSDKVGGYLTENNITVIDSYVAGYAVHAIFSKAPYTLIIEYVAAADDFKVNELEFAGGGAQPTAWNIEFGYALELAGKEVTLALGYQGTDEALALAVPRQRLMGSIGIGVYENTSLALEWAHDKDYDGSDGGTGEDADTVTFQLAVEF